MSDRPEPAARRLADRLPASQRPTGRRSARLHRFMVASFARFFRRHMNGLRLARGRGPNLPAGAGPLVIYTNHPAWWDAVVGLIVADRLFPAYESYAPIDAEMLGKYGVFGRIGAFGVELDTARGAAVFLAASADVLSRPGRALWVTAQGRFADVRERPLGLRAGIARLPELAPDAWFVPLGLEYAFWVERGAEAFVAFGDPVRGRDLLGLPRAARRDRLEADLTAVLDRLSADVRSREPERFESLLEGRSGVGGVYDVWRRLKAALRGEAFDPAHGKGAR